MNTADTHRRMAQMIDEGGRFMKEIFVDEIYKDARPKLTVVDLGAFEGEFSFYCLPFAKDIYSVEPDPKPFEKLVENIRLLEVNNVKAFNIAIGKEDGTRTMIMGGNGGSQFCDNQTQELTRVETKTLKTFMEENNIKHIDILKVDIESAEKEIFESQAFKEVVDKIDFIIGEHNGFNVLRDYGFEVNEDGNAVFTARRP